MSIRETMSPLSFLFCPRPIQGAALRRRCKTDRTRRSSAKAKATRREQPTGETNLARGLCLRKDGLYATGKNHRCCDSRGDGLAYNESAAGSRPARDDRQSHRLLPAAAATQSAEFARVLWIGRRADPKGAGNRRSELFWSRRRGFEKIARD